MEIRSSFILMILLAAASSTQAHSTWTRTYDSESAYQRYILPLESGDFIAAARMSGSPMYSTWLLKVDSLGEMVWEKNIDHGIYGIAETSDGGFMVLLDGYTEDYLSRFDTEGEQLWSDPLGEYVRTNIQGTFDGCFIFGAGDEIRKVDESGTQVWATEIPDSLDTFPWMVGPAFGEPNGAMISSAKIYYPSQSPYYSLSVIDSNGSLSWSGEFRPHAYDVLEILGGFSDAEGNCYGLCVFSYGTPPPMTTEYMVKYNSQGDLQWSRQPTDAVAACPAHDSGIIVLGRVFSGSDHDCWIRKLSNASGSTIWEVEHSFPNRSMSPRAVAACPAGGYIILGTVVDPFEMFLVRTDSTGQANPVGIQITDHNPLNLTVSPSPASSSVIVQLSSPQAGNVSVIIHDLAGREVAALHGTAEGSGKLQLGWDLSDSAGHPVPSGLYTVTASSEGIALTGRVMVIR